MTKLYMGIDTSNYTTSIGVVDEKENILFNSRIVLNVGEKSHGLRQQEAVFQHLNNLPILIKELTDIIDVKEIETISVSSTPRNIADSYMPVFVVGKNQAFMLSRILNNKYKEFSHQEGHIAAGLLNYEKYLDEFISLHISGGTTEILYVENKIENFDIQIIGGSLDINFGQLIDRIGVYLGFKFPCGLELEKFASNGKLLNINIPISIKEKYWTNISGLENFFINLIDSKEYRKEDIIFTLFYTIGKIIDKLIKSVTCNYDIEDILITGGVSANTYIRNLLQDNSKLNYIFPSVNLSTDNGVGIALLGKLKQGHRGC